MKTINGISVDIVLGDITKQNVDALMVTEFDNMVSRGSMAKAVILGGARPGMIAYEKFIEQHGRQKNGDVIVTESGGGNAKYLLHAITLDVPKESEFEIVQKATLTALLQASQKRIETIAAPALGNGIIGSLTAQQSAKAILSALDVFPNYGNIVKKFTIVIYQKEDVYEEFLKVLENGNYSNAAPEKGTKEFSVTDWFQNLEIKLH